MVQVKVGSFTKSTTAATPTAVVQQTVTGVGFEPRIIIFQFTQASAALADGYQHSFGFADLSTWAQPVCRSVGWTSADADTTVTHAFRTSSETNCIQTVNPTGTTQVGFRIVSTNSDGFIIEYNNNTTTASQDVYYMAVAGTDLANVRAGTFNPPSLAGTQNVTGLGFQPDFALFLSPDDSENRNNSDSGVSIGFAKSSSKRGSMNITSMDARTDNTLTRRYLRTDKCITLLDPAGASTPVGEADFIGFTSDGFDLNWTTGAGSKNFYAVFFLAIKGGTWDVGNFSQPTSATGNQTVTASVVPKGIMFMGDGDAAANTTVNEPENFMIGAAQSATARWTAYGGNNSRVLNPSVAAMGKLTTRSIRFITPAPTGSASAANSEADFVSFGASPSTNFTLNWLSVDATARAILYFAVGDAGVQTVTKHLLVKYNNAGIVTKTSKIRYNMGGVVVSLPLTGEYNLLGFVTKKVTIKYGIQKLLTKHLLAKYDVALSRSAITKVGHIRWNNSAFVFPAKKVRILYSMDEDPKANSSGYGKPLRPRIYIMTNDGSQTLHQYNAFRPTDPAASTLHINACEVNLANDGPGDFRIHIEDHLGQIDRLNVGPGSKVLIQAAKTETALSDGNHDLIVGYVKSARVLRPAANAMEYELTGWGSAIRFTERVTSFHYAAQRQNFNSPEPDKDDPSMRAYQLMLTLLQSADHLPIGTPLENEFTVRGVLSDNPHPVDNFIPSIQKDLVEWDAVANQIADTAGAIYGVTYSGGGKEDIFLRYPALEHSGIIIKDVQDLTNDDKFKTSYIDGSWSYEDRISKEDGFTNRFLARIGVKSGTSNLTSLDAVRDKFTALYKDPTTTTNPSLPPSPPPDAENAKYGIMIPLNCDPSRTDIVDSLVALQKKRPKVKLVVALPEGSASTNDQLWRTFTSKLKAGAVTVLGTVDLQAGGISDSSTKKSMDNFLSFYNVDGYYFTEVDLRDGVGPVPLSQKTVDYNNSLDDYAKNTKGVKFTVGNVTQVPGRDTWGTGHLGGLTYNLAVIDTLVDTNFQSGSASIVSRETGFLDSRWLPDFGPERSVLHGVGAAETSVFTADQVKQIMTDLSVTNKKFNWFYFTDQGVGVTNSSNLTSIYFNRNLIWFTLSHWLETIASKLDDIIAQTGTGGTTSPGIVLGDIPDPTQPTARDLAQSFVVGTNRLSDLTLVLSKVGNPIFDEASTEGNPAVKAQAVHGHIETSTQVTLYIRDPNDSTKANATVFEVPSGTNVGYFNIPFNEIGTDPTTIYLNNIVLDPKAIIQPNDRYWLVLFGRGQDEDNTIRWHHSDTSQFSYYAASRYFGGHNVSVAWDLFSNVQGPAFSFVFFQTQITLLEASDSDSIEQYGLIESPIDLSSLDEAELAAKLLQSILFYSAKPKRIYDIQKVTAPDDLILPGKLVTIMDSLSGLTNPRSGIGTTAEVIQASYVFDANTGGIGSRWIKISPVGYVDFAFEKWRRLWETGQI